MSDNQNSQMAEFLMFGYFGYTSNEISDMCPCYRIRMCANRAYLDLNRTIEFEDGASEEDKESFRKTCCCVLVHGISEILENSELHSDYDESKQKLFDQKHSEICEAIEDIANKRMITSSPNTSLLKKKGEKGFYYGQAQKWLNMTLKYMELLDLNNTRSIRELLHIPIDRYILRAASCSEKSQYSRSQHSLRKKIAPERHLKEDAALEKVFYSDERAKPWSQLNQTDYEQLQQDLRVAIKEKQEDWDDIKCPLDWEAKAWIEQAQLERK